MYLKLRIIVTGDSYVLIQFNVDVAFFTKCFVEQKVDEQHLYMPFNTINT